jgi:type IV secretion system protein VirB4
MSKAHYLSEVIPYRSFVDEGFIDLRGDGIATGFDMSGPSPEVDDGFSLTNRVRQFAAALLHLGTRDSVHILFHRTPAPMPPPREFQHRAAAMVDEQRRAQFAAENYWINTSHLYLSHHYEQPFTAMFRAALLTTQGPERQSQQALLQEYAIRRFASFQDTAETAVGLRRLRNVEMFRDLIHTVTYRDFAAMMPEPHVRLNQIIALDRQIGGTAPFINGYYLKPVCLYMYPAYTAPQILAVLLRQPGEMTIGARFLAYDPYDAQRELEIEKHHWNREIMGTLWKIFKSWMNKHAPVEASEDSCNQIANINTALAALAAGTAFGRVSITAIPRDKDEKRCELRAHEIIKECNAMGITSRIEDMNATEAIMATWPGRVEENIRRPLMTGANFGDLVLPAEHWKGLPYIDSPFYPPETPSPLVCGGAGSLSPFYYPTHINGVPSQLIIGPIGTGKSALIANMVCAYLGIPNARIAWLDLGYSSFVLGHLLQAEYHDVGAAESVPLCPLAMLDQPDGLQWLMGWFQRMFKRHDLELRERQWDNFRGWLVQAKEGTNYKGEPLRQLIDLRGLVRGEDHDTERIREILQQYCLSPEFGGWGHVFNGKPTANGHQRVTIYELQELMALGIIKRATAPAMELILHQIMSGLDGSPTWIFADEFWSLLGDDISAEWLFAALRTLRRRNTGFVGCTQSLVEIVNSPYRDLLLESCPGKVFLPNFEINSDYVRESYYKMGLNPHETTIIGNARPRREYYFRSSIGSRLFTLELDDVAKAICAATGYTDVSQARLILSESPGELFFDAWLDARLTRGERGLPIPATTQGVARR